MVSGLLAILMLGVIVATVRATAVPGRDDRILPLLVGSYFLRLFVQTFSRDLALFSHGGGGDYVAYELWALDIVRYWSFFGFQFVSQAELPELGPTSLPSNLFAVVIALNGGQPAPFACTALVAGMACLSCLNIYLLATEHGAAPRPAFTLTALFLLSPAFVLYTSDMYKDGPVLFFTVGAVASAIRLSRRFSPLHLLFTVVSLFALWHVRYYLVFLAAAPLVVGLTGARAKSSIRPILATLVLAASFVLVAASTDVFDTVTDRANATFERSTSTRVRLGNAAGGSGVTFDDGGDPWGAMGPKLAYTLFAPFPWAGGSVGFHIGKIDTLLWYYLLWRAGKAARRLFTQDRTLLLMLAIVVIPTTVAYATSFANVGLMLRQRLVIVQLTMFLALLSWPAPRVAQSAIGARLDTERTPRRAASAAPPVAAE